MVKLPPLWIGRGALRKRFPLGTIRNIVNASMYDREIRLGERQEEIFGVPTAWLDCLNVVGVFSNPERSLIMRTYARGTSSKKDEEKIQSFSISKQLAKAGLSQFSDTLNPTFRKTAKLPFNYDSKVNPPIEMSQIRKLFGTPGGVVQDGVIHYNHVKDGIDGTNVLWAKSTKHQNPNTKVWDKYSQIINKLHKLHYPLKGVKRRHMTTNHLDIIAIHEEDNWFLNKDKARDAINNAYIEDYVKKKLYPMLAGTRARGVIYKRTEHPQPSALPTEAEPLFSEGRKGLEAVLKEDQKKLNNYLPD